MTQKTIAAEHTEITLMTANEEQTYNKQEEDKVEGIGPLIKNTRINKEITRCHLNSRKSEGSVSFTLTCVPAISYDHIIPKSNLFLVQI